MESILNQRIRLLCEKKDISVTRLESELGFGNGAIGKWEKSCSPSIDKIAKVANFFGVTTDYLLGRTDIEKSASDVLQDEDMISIQRARQIMPPQDRTKMMQMLKLGFEYAFTGQEDDNE